MDRLLYLLPTLVCPISMGLVMWFMMRGKRDAPAGAPAAQQQELARLRSEVEALRTGPAAPRADLHMEATP